ncbi:Plug domain-containing protein [soil metagenome]
MNRLFFVIILIFFNSIFSQAQQVTQKLEEYTGKYPRERVYLHYDKASYAPGETIWFKAYLMEGIFPATNSKTLYIDWTDASGKLLSHISSPVVNGTAISQFDIPSDYSAAFIHVKAYTKWMLNFDSAFLYNKDLRVLGTKNTNQLSGINRTPSLRFFPEGGDIIEEIENKIAFKAIDQFGMPVKVSGNIYDNGGKEVGKIEVLHDGMGYIFLKPAPGASYAAKWNDEKGNSYNTDLPAVINSGVNLQVTSSDSNQIFSINVSKNSGYKNLNIVGSMYQHPVFSINKSVGEGNAKGVVPTSELPSGILTISVFDEDWKLLTERISFINNHEYEFYPEMTVQHWGLNKRARNEIEILVPPDLAATLSVSVTDMDIETDSSDNIISYLLLTGELHGRIFNPSWYFSGGENSRMDMLDLVMLTNGWRRIQWQEVIAGNEPDISYPRDTSYLTISGKVYGAMPTQLRNAGSIILLVNNKEQGKRMLTPELLADGSFSDGELILFDTANVYYQLPKDKGLDGASVKFMEDRLPPLRNNMAATGQFYSHMLDTLGNARHLQLARELAELTKRYEGKVLETVNITARTTTPLQELEKKYTSGLFQGGDGYQFDLINDTRAMGSQSIFNYLQGQVAGLQINTTSNPPSLQWRGSSPAIYINEVPSDASMVSSMAVSDIAYVKVFRPPFMGGIGGGAGGAIAIYTRKGNDAKPEPGKGLANNTITGYTAIREFSSPNYGTFTSDDDKRDIRTTLYWNPTVTTQPSQNKVLLTFYNTDITRAFRVTIEGMTKDGKLAHVEQIME